MELQGLGFMDAVESLADRFHVPLEVIELSKDERGESKKALREALRLASRFYNFYLLHTDEGHEALKYLYARGIDLEFIRKYQIGLAPAPKQIFSKFMHGQKVSTQILIEAGLMSEPNMASVNSFKKELPFLSMMQCPMSSDSLLANIKILPLVVST